MTDPKSLHQLDRDHATTLLPWREPPWSKDDCVGRDVVLDCFWGRLIFAHTFESNDRLLQTLQQEQENHRDIALYVADPHVLVALAPQELFLDPSHTYRLYYERYRAGSVVSPNFDVRPLRSIEDANAVNAIYARRHMMSVEPRSVFEHGRGEGAIVHLVAQDHSSGDIVGTVTGVDHVRAFGDPERGTSLWALAVDPQTHHPGVGEALVRGLVDHFRAQGRGYTDLSVMHDNRQAIRLYEKLGFSRVPVFSIKTRSKFNEPLFSGDPAETLNPYARIITMEAQRRGVNVVPLDVEESYFSLSFGGRTIVCRESLSELTTAIAMSRCDDKRVTHRLLRSAGLRVPDQLQVQEPEPRREFLAEHGRIVVKPARGEQGVGVSVGVRTEAELEVAVARAGAGQSPVILEQMVPGDDLRIIVIDFRVAAAAVRKPPEIVGDGQRSVRDLIARQSRRRSAATDGESTIPVDSETERCLAGEGVRLDDVLPQGRKLTVRKTANLHTGGTMHDVTDILHPRLRAVAKRAAEVLDIPVVGLDLMVPDVRAPEYAIIEANERPGLANHEPQPVAARFLDLLFPQTAVPS